MASEVSDSAPVGPEQTPEVPEKPPREVAADEGSAPAASPHQAPEPAASCGWEPWTEEEVESLRAMKADAVARPSYKLIAKKFGRSQEDVTYKWLVLSRGPAASPGELHRVDGVLVPPKKCAAPYWQYLNENREALTQELKQAGSSASLPCSAVGKL